MKTNRSKLMVAAMMLVMFIAGMLAMRASTTIWGSMATLTAGTNYSSTFPLFTAQFPGQLVSIQHGGLAHTNDLPIYGQITLGVDASGVTNYMTISGPWYPSATNAGTYSWMLAPTNIQMYGRAFTIQTNTVQVGGGFN